jgi:cytochrome c2
MAQDIGDAKKGGTLAQAVCAECHTVDVTPKPSLNPMPPSITLVARSSGITATALRVWLQYAEYRA